MNPHLQKFDDLFADVATHLMQEHTASSPTLLGGLLLNLYRQSRECFEQLVSSVTVQITGPAEDRLGVIRDGERHYTRMEVAELLNWDPNDFDQMLETARQQRKKFEDAVNRGGDPVLPAPVTAPHRATVVLEAAPYRGDRCELLNDVNRLMHYTENGNWVDLNKLGAAGLLQVVAGAMYVLNTVLDKAKVPVVDRGAIADAQEAVEKLCGMLSRQATQIDFVDVRGQLRPGRATVSSAPEPEPEPAPAPEPQEDAPPRRRRGPMSEEHRRAISEGRARAKAARQASLAVA